MPDDFQDRYEIISRIGAGGVGAVYKARDTRLGRMVAVKRLLSPDESEDQAKLGSDLIKEARALSAFQHPNIITVFDYGEDEDGLYIIMELLEGETVEEIAQNSQLHVDTLTELAEQCLEGLSVAHGRNLLHRDLKPSNIFVTKVTGGEAQVKLLDFGLAKFSSAPALQTVDQSRSILGSVYFMAPEQFLRQPLDARCDLYQLGCVFFYALTSQYAFDGETTAAVMDAHLDHTPKDLATLRPDVPKALRDWMISLIALEPEDRPKTAAKALQQLRIIAQKHDLPAAAPFTEEPVTKQKSAIIESDPVSLSATEAYLQKQKDLAEKKLAVKLVTEKQISTPVWVAGISVLTAAFIGIIAFALTGKDHEEPGSEKPVFGEIEGTEAQVSVETTQKVNEPMETVEAKPGVAELEIDLVASKGVLSGLSGIPVDPSRIGDRVASWVDQAPIGGDSRPSYLILGDGQGVGAQPIYRNAVLFPGEPPRPSIGFLGAQALFIESKWNGGTDLSETARGSGTASFFILASPAQDSDPHMGLLSWDQRNFESSVFCFHTSNSEFGFALESDGMISKTDSLSVPIEPGPGLFELEISENRRSVRITRWNEEGELLRELETEFSEPVLFKKVTRVGGHRWAYLKSPRSRFRNFEGDIFAIRIVSGASMSRDQRREHVRAMWKRKL